MAEEEIIQQLIFEAIDKYNSKGFRVIGCSREKADYIFEDYRHYSLAISE
jgi:hypothetical protein